MWTLLLRNAFRDVVLWGAGCSGRNERLIGISGSTSGSEYCVFEGSPSRFSFWNADVDLLFNLSSRALDASNIFFLRNSRRKASDCRAEFASAVPESLLSIIINTKITCNLTIWVWPYCCKIPSCPCQGNADKPIGNEPLLVNFKPSRYLSKTYALNIKTFSYGNLIIILCHKPMRIEDLEMRAHP